VAISWRKGLVVESISWVVESDFNGAEEWAHSEPGERGTVAMVEDEEYVLVTWHRTGTTSSTHVEDLLPILDGTSVPPRANRKKIDETYLS
jgi:hypothetical protein